MEYLSIKSKDDERAISMNNQAERIVSIGYIQFSPALGNVSATIQQIDSLIHVAEGADILVLTELCNSG